MLNCIKIKIFVWLFCAVFATDTVLFAQQLTRERLELQTSPKNLPDRQTQQMVDLHIRKGDTETDDAKAIVHYTNALELSPRCGMIHIKIADRYKNMNQTDMALNSFRNVIRFGGDTTYAMFQQAQILKGLSVKDGFNVNLAVEAARRYREVYLRDSSRVEAVKNRGILLYKLAENSQADDAASRRLANEAVIMLKKHIEINTRDRETREHLYKTYILLGDTESAKLWVQ